MMTMDAATIRDMLLFTAQRIIDNRDLLTKVDSAIGDGDHGIGMAGGMEQAIAALHALEPLPDPYAVFSATGRAMLTSMGGASGVIFGSLYMGGAKGQSGNAISPEELAAFFDRSRQVIQKRGGAQQGDKTMLDALIPAVDAMRGHSAQGFVSMLEAAQEAAREGMEATKGYAAKFGRAKSLMERAVGHQDAGATSVWIMFQAMRDFFLTHCANNTDEKQI